MLCDTGMGNDFWVRTQKHKEQKQNQTNRITELKSIGNKNKDRQIG